MTEKEKQLFKALCKFKEKDFDEALLAHATPTVLGQLFFNRMQGVAYDVLKTNGLLGKVNREFRNSLGSAYEQNKEKNHSFFKCINVLSGILAQIDCKAAMLKGAILCAYYPEGCRTSNDIDLLVLPSDVTLVGNALTKSGFRQGNVREGEFVPASRNEIIASKMLRGETVPYIKEVDLPYMKYLEVDINFSLDYKNSDTGALSSMLESTIVFAENGIKIPSLNACDFFIHLCAHLCKEATTLYWVEMHRDMTLYKYCDIYLLLKELSDETIEKIFARASELGLSHVCAYAILEASNLFDIAPGFAQKKSAEILACDKDFTCRVISPKDQKIFIYKTKSTTERFFMNERAKDLEEVSDEKA